MSYGKTNAERDYIIEFSPELQRVYFDIQKLKLRNVRETIAAYEARHPENVFSTYLENYADLHYLLISEDKKAFQQLSKLEDTRLSKIDLLPDSSPYKLFFQADIRIHWAFAKIKFGSHLSGAWDVIKAYKLLAANQKKFPHFTPTLKSLGLLHILIGSVPDQYTWVTKILGLKGDILLGKQEIQKVIDREPLFRQEAILTDLLVHSYTLKLSNSQHKLLRQLPKEQPDNLLIHFFATTILMKEGKSEEALWYLDRAPGGEDYIKFPFLNYLKGEIFLQKGLYGRAIKEYNRFLHQYRGFNYLKDSNMKLFMCYWLANHDQHAQPYINKILSGGTIVLEGDQFAEKFAEKYKSGKISAHQKILFRARYASDGGYLEEAWNLLDDAPENTFSNQYDKAELNYRKGRILQKQANFERSIPFFKRAIALHVPSSAGISASSALQLGYLALENNNRPEAEKYFGQALSFKNHEYKNSIDSKARAALSELGK